MDELTFGIEFEFAVPWPCRFNPNDVPYYQGRHLQYAAHLEVSRLLREKARVPARCEFDPLDAAAAANPYAFWQIASDCSLNFDFENARTMCAGYAFMPLELKTPIMTAGNEHDELQICSVLNALKDHFAPHGGIAVNNSCGMHVHVGRRCRLSQGRHEREWQGEGEEGPALSAGFLTSTLASLATLVTACEHTINGLHPPHRQNNRYCYTPSCVGPLAPMTPTQRLNFLWSLRYNNTNTNPNPTPNFNSSLSSSHRYAHGGAAAAASDAATIAAARRHTLHNTLNPGDARQCAYNFVNLRPASTLHPPELACDASYGPQAGRLQQRHPQRTIEFRQAAAGVDGRLHEALSAVAWARFVCELVRFAHRFRRCRTWAPMLATALQCVQRPAAAPPASFVPSLSLLAADAGEAGGWPPNGGGGGGGRGSGGVAPATGIGNGAATIVTAHDLMRGMGMEKLVIEALPLSAPPQQQQQQQQDEVLQQVLQLMAPHGTGGWALSMTPQLPWPPAGTMQVASFEEEEYSCSEVMD